MQILEKTEDIILFIDELHMIVEAGAAEGSSMDAANVLKPALANGKITIIGSTTSGEYRKFIEKDPALERRFQKICDGTINRRDY
jgi:ATPases with chaperone activity, ATP-binding subunit